MESIITAPEAGARLQIAQDVVRVLASGAQTGGGYEIFELEGPEGSGPPPHAHPWAESYIVVEGEADVLLDGAWTVAKPGSFYHVPAGARHTYRIRTSSAKFVVITSEGRASGFFHDADQKCDPATVMSIATKHGLTL